MTLRDKKRIIELEGINYVRGVVQAHNSIYQQIDGENDQGNDCYIEFVLDNISSNAGVFAQVKSGDSYKDSKGYKFQTDKEHVNYWGNGLYPIAGIVYDVNLKKAFWVNITEYIKSHPDITSIQHPTIRVSSSNEFIANTFGGFVMYFKKYIEDYKGYENYGRSLDQFSNLDKPILCFEGLKSLYANHRNRKSMWHYIITNFGNIQSERIQENILGLLSVYGSNPDYFWHQRNIQYSPPQQMAEYITELLSAYFGEKEIRIAFRYLLEGVNRGSFSFQVFLVIDLIKDVDLIIKKIALEDRMALEDRNHWFWLYLHLAQRKPRTEVLFCIDQYLESYPAAKEDEVIVGMRQSIDDGIFVPIG